jgi:hypothetical protein
MTQHPDFESIAIELLLVYDITTPPIPIENMLQRPRADMWEQVDITQLSSSFLTLNDVYSPRMSLARMLARHVASSQWGKDHGLTVILENPDLLYAFGRMLIMPRDMVMELSASARTPTAMSVHFEVPEEDARLRLREITG